MLTIMPSSGPSDTPALARASAASAAARAASAYAGFAALPFQILDAVERLFEPLASGKRFHAKFHRFVIDSHIR
jgi:hypothetical protein